MKEQLILKLLNETSKTIKQNIEADTTYEIVEKDYGRVNCSYEPQDDIEDLLFKIGKIIDNKLLIEMFGKPATIEEIIAYSNNNCQKYCDLSDIFKELEQVSSSRDEDNDEEKYQYFNIIYKHIPSGKFYGFTDQCGAGGFIQRLFDGEVVEKQITKTIWEVVND